jgi:chromosome segregation ATPase
MSPRRSERDSDCRSDSNEQVLPMLASETMRTSKSHVMPKELNGKSSDEKVSLFWRIFGGTILSIVSLLVITAYQSISSSIHDLRTELSQLKEAKAEFVKKDDYTAARTRMWDRMQEIDKQVATATAPIAQMKERMTQLDEQTRTTAGERKDMNELHATIKERMAQFEQQLAQGKMTQKDLQMMLQTIGGLQEKSVLRDQQLKQLEDERKELMKEIQALRERLARMEAAKDAASKPEGPARSEKARSGDHTHDG